MDIRDVLQDQGEVGGVGGSHDGQGQPTQTPPLHCVPEVGSELRTTPPPRDDRYGGASIRADNATENTISISIAPPVRGGGVGLHDAAGMVASRSDQGVGVGAGVWCSV